jgi:hypothetical protein
MTQEIEAEVEGAFRIGEPIGFGDEMNMEPARHESPIGRAGVGPTLRASPFSWIVVAAIEVDNDDVQVDADDSSIRVQTEDVCRLRRSVIEGLAHRSVMFPNELESVMSSFEGRLVMDSDRAIWWRPSRTRSDPLAPQPAGVLARSPSPEPPDRAGRL